MTQRGGSATAYGILYQILGTLGRAANISFRGSVSSGDVDDATLVIEPIGGGGDLQIVTGERLVIEQWKARSGNETWSLEEVIQSVLPDLFMASDLDGQVYRFVTEGRMGTWEEAYRFFRGLGPCPASGLPSDSLDDGNEVEFSRSYRCSARSLFLRVVEAVRVRPAMRDRPEEAIQRKLWLVLSRFEMEQLSTTEELAEEIDEALERVVERVEDIAGKRRELCGWILEMAGTGNVRVSPEALLVRAGLTPRSFLGWNELRERLRERLEGRLQRSGYSPDLDVREPPTILSPAPILVITGESGQGKTWQLAALARKAAASQSLAVWVPAARLQQSADQIAADEIWRGGLGKDGPLSLESVVERRRRVLSNAPRPWAFVCVDGVHSRDEASYLAQVPWAEWGLRLAISAPREVADHLRRVAAEQVEVVETADFSPVQVRDYLIRRGRSWADTPTDIRQLLRRPVLTQLYADLAQQRDWVPRTEYELMERYWHRIREHPRSAPQDFGAIQALAATVLEEQPRYPWSPGLLDTARVSPETVQRLKESGWLRQLEDGVLECWHDRLLCWAAAKLVATRVEHRIWTIDDAANTLRALQGRTDHWGRRLGYVAMDTIWLLADPSRADAARNEKWKLIAALEELQGLGFVDESLYQDLFPTAGSRLVPLLLDRLRQAARDGHETYPRLVARALLSIARRDEESVRAVIPSCLRDADPRIQEVGLRLLPALPSAELTDPAWELHRQTLGPGGDVGEDRERYQLGFRAMCSVLETCPSWTQGKIESPGADAHLIAELAYLLASLSSPEAARVWTNVKRQAIQAVPDRKRRSIINCILRFRDSDNLGLLREWAHSDVELVGPTAVDTLAYFDPEGAIGLIREVPRRSLIFGGDLRAVLMALAPEATCAAIKELALADVEHAHVYFNLVDGDRADGSTIESMIDWVDGRLAEHLEAHDSATKSRLFRPLRLLHESHGSAVLDALRGRRGSAFEERLWRAASQWADNTTGWLDHEFEAAMGILLRIGGEGITRVVNSLLKATSQLSQLKGCEEAATRPDGDTRLLVASLARSDRRWGDRPDGPPVVQMRAIEALAALDENAELVRAIMKWGTQISPYVAEIRRGKPAMSDEQFDPAVAALADPSPSQVANAILALGFTGRPDMRPRIKDLFVKSDLNSDVAICSMLALEVLGGCETDLHDRLLGQYRSGHHKYAALRLMAACDQQVAAPLLAAAVQHPEPYDDVDQRIIGFLGASDRTRPLVREQLRRLRDPAASQPLHFMMDAAELLDPRDARDEQELWEIVSQPTGRIRIGSTRASALRRLAETRPDVAFDLALQSLTDVDGDWDEMPGIMLDLAPEKALPALIEHAAVAYNQLTCRVIGIALRAHRGAGRIADALAVLLGVPSGRGRRVAACLAGYLGPGFLEPRLREVVLSDGDREVCREAAYALRRQQREADAARIVASCLDPSSASAWGVVEDVLGLADPRVLTSRGDDIGFRAMLKGAAYLLRRHAWTKIEKLEKKTEDDVKSHSARWD